MSLDMFQACIKGYSDRLIDQQILNVQTGYWAAYYVGGRHPKSPKKIAEDILGAHKRSESAPTPTVTTDEDVEKFLEREAKFKARLGR